MRKKLKFSIILFTLATSLTTSALEKKSVSSLCGRFDLQGEGLYDGFILSEKYATILSIEKFKSPYYIEGGMIHIPHNRGGEFLLEIQNDGQVLRGQDFWTKGTAYKKVSDEGCK